MRGSLSIILLILSNVFMTFAWYGHIKFSQYSWFSKLSIISIILISWGIALFEYLLQVPANRIGHESHGGPFNLWQLKIIQEVITLSVFVVFMLFFFKNEALKWNHILAFVFMIGAVYLVFKK